MKEKFMSFEELQELELTGGFTIEDNGMSGQHYGYHWYTVTNDETEESFEAYVK